MTTAICEICGEEFSRKRKALGYNICLVCGEEQANKKKTLLYETLNHDNERISFMVCK